jgi:hypothetical protein
LVDAEAVPHAGLKEDNMEYESDESDERPPPPRLSDRCKSCGYAQTWADQRRQFGRLIRAGFDRDQVKALLPRCQKCLTQTLKNL